jgi:two-component system chemotaxis response regulator CheB
MNISVRENERDRSPPSERESALTVVAMAASAGGINALSKVLSGLPVDFPAAVVVVQHLAPHYPSYIVPILARRTKLSVKLAKSGDLLETSTVYIAPPDWHVTVKPNRTLWLDRSETVNFVRPSADILFVSVAQCFKTRAIALVLTGTGGDGVGGVKAIAKAGGTVVAQDEATSEFYSMPSRAIATGVVNRIVPLPQIASTLIELVK